MKKNNYILVLLLGFIGITNVTPAAESLTTSEQSQQLFCVVCQEDIKPVECFLSLSCDHSFHRGCILTWLTNKRTCPICVQDIDIENIELTPQELVDHQQYIVVNQQETTIQQIVNDAIIGNQINVQPLNHPNIQENFSMNELLFSVVWNNFEDFGNALRSGINVNFIDPTTGYTALIIAAINGNLPIVMTLLTLGADVTHTDAQGLTALMHARSNEFFAPNLEERNRIIALLSNPELREQFIEDNLNSLNNHS
ncbi:MAG TPA: RING finger domain-containing protein [Candidatus Babeliales bacterium]|nr:RING finger domain-containing protein [Candidatus Babeliales bacterium]